MIKYILKILHFFGGDELLLKISIAAAMPFFEWIALWPNEGEKVTVMVFAASKFHLDSFLSSYRSEDAETND